MHTHADHHHGEQGGMLTAFLLNLLFAALELAGGLWTNSLAIASDALHDFGDAFSLGVSWYLEQRAEQPSNERYSYGYRRFSLLGALINASVLIIGSVFVLSEAIPRLLQPEETHASGMLIFAIGGILANGIAALRVRGGESMTGRTISAQVVMWHLLEDVLGWIAILIVSVVLLVKDVPILDPLLSVLITGYVLYQILNRLRRTISIFLQGVPADVDVAQIESRIAAVEGICSIHHTHVWSLDGAHHVLSTHLVVDDDVTPQQALDIKCRVKAILSERFEHMTIEIEYGHESCPMLPTESGVT